MTTSLTPQPAVNYPKRVRNELRFRTLQVLSNQRIAGNFQRVVLGGADLAGFASSGFDDHIKLFFPQPGASFAPPTLSEDGIVWPEGVRPQARDYTPMYDALRNELTLDFYIHEAGVASDWARNAQPGDSLTIGGPRGSLVVPENYHWQLYVCDETGMPALLRRLAALSSLSQPVEVQAFIAVHDAASKSYFDHLNLRGVTLNWFVGEERAQIAERLQQLDVPDNDYFLWLTGEGETVLGYGSHFEKRHIDAQLLRTVAYWHKK